MSPRSQAERRASTQGALVAAGRRLFTAHGFAAVSAEHLVAEAGVTRGALHHHFGDKRGLFRAVFEQVEAELTAELAETLLADGDEVGLDAALAAFLDLCERPEVRRLALTEAPAVLGWATWREIEAQHGLGLLVALLESSPLASSATPAPLLAQLVLSAVVEGALMIAGADDPERVRAQVEASLTTLFDGLLTT